MSVIQVTGDAPQGVLMPPFSKSIAHRAILCAAPVKGRSVTPILEGGLS